MSNPTVSRHAELTAATVATVTIPVSSSSSVVIHQIEGTAPVYFRVGKGPAAGVADPASEQNDTFVLHDGCRARELIHLQTEGDLIIKAISAAAGAIHVEVLG